MNISGLSTVLRIACLCLTLMSVPVAAQIRDTASHSEDVAGGGRKETTETKFEDGTVSIETKYWDANGKLQSHANETKHPDGDTTTTTKSYNSQGELTFVAESRKDVNGRNIYRLVETYQSGELKTGDSFYFDETGAIKAHRRYDPKTQAYEQVSAPTGESHRVSITEAEARIKAHLAYVEKRRSEMAAAFYYNGAKKTLEESFKKRGITFSLQYANSWGEMGIGLFWSEEIKPAYAHVADVLNNIIGDLGGLQITSSYLDSIDRMMESWKQSEQQFQKHFESLVELYTKEAVVTDQQEAASEKYYAKIDGLQKQQPRSGKDIDAANDEWAKDKKNYSDRLAEIDKEIRGEKDAAGKLAEGVQHLAVTKPTSTP